MTAEIEAKYSDRIIHGMVHPVTGDLVPVDWRVIERRETGRKGDDQIINLDLMPPPMPRKLPKGSRVLMNGLVVSKPES